MKTLIVTLMAVMSFSIAAHEMLAAPCGYKLELEKYPELEDIKRHLEWHGATNNVIKKSPCKTLKVLDPSEMDEYIAKKAQETKGKSNATINGVTFSDESPALINAFNNLTTAMDSFGIYKDPKSQKNFQQEFSINPECKKVSCAVSIIWGNDLGKKILYVYLKHGFNTSEYAFMDSDRLNKDEMEDIILGLEDLPKQFIPLGKTNQRLTHFSRGYHLKNDSDRVAANALVMLFDTWSNEPRFERQYSIYHEMSHNIGTKLAHMDEKPVWINMSGWVKKGENWSHDPKGCFATQYGLETPFEDYAEALSTYRYNPKDFKSRCPEKYNFIKDKVYNGVEYFSDANCSDVPAAKIQNIFSEIAHEVDKELSKLAIDKNVLKEKCESSLSKFPVNESELKSCQVELVRDQISKISPETMKLVLTKNNLSLDSARLPQLQSVLAESMLASGALTESAQSLLSNVAKSANDYFEDFIGSALPKEVDGKIQGFEMGSFGFYYSQKCRKEIWTGDLAIKRKCASDYLISEDRRWTSIGYTGSGSKFRVPDSMDADSKKALLEKYYAEVEKTFTQTPLLDSMIAKNSKEIKDAAKSFFKSAGHAFYSEKSDWKTLEPKEFCQKFFTPGDYYKKYVVPAGSDGFPGFQEWCEQRQSEKKNRFQFSDSDLNDWVELTLK